MSESPNIHVRNYDHYNKALGKHITSKRHYEEEMKRQGCVPFEKGQELVAKSRANQRKDYKISDESARFMNEVKLTADKKGNVKLGDRAIDYLNSLKLKDSKHRPGYSGGS